jgi:hypothetical protein
VHRGGDQAAETAGDQGDTTVVLQADLYQRPATPTRIDSRQMIIIGDGR